MNKVVRTCMTAAAVAGLCYSTLRALAWTAGALRGGAAPTQLPGMAMQTLLHNLHQANVAGHTLAQDQQPPAIE